MSDAAFSDLKDAFQEMVDYEHGRRPNLRTTTLELPSAPLPLSAERVTEIRMKMQSSQAMFARILNVSPRTVQDWEQGRRSPSDAALKLLAVADKHPEALFDGATHAGARIRPAARTVAQDRVVARATSTGRIADHAKSREREVAPPKGHGRTGKSRKKGR